ncbi:MAG: murein transglycosylase domain-containing protein [Desulfobacterales bacterium]|nr:murein transglycosylase domain-containing protein [Desulfobacterales bacterium]
MRALSIILIIAVYSILSEMPADCQQGQDFDSLLKQATEEKEAEWKIQEAEIERIDAGFERMWQERKAEIERKWDEALRSTKKEWVDYSDNLDSRSYVNFEDGFVEVTAIVPQRGKDAVPQAEQFIFDQINRVLSTDNPSGMNVLAGQVDIEPGHIVSPNNVPDFIEKTRKKIVVADKPFVAQDGVPRIKVKVRFELLPDHLMIRAKKYYDAVDRNSKKLAVRPELVLAVIHTESYFNPLAVSPANAHGLMQLIPKWGARDAYRMIYKKDRIVTPEYLYIPKNNVELGSAYLSLLRDGMFKQVADDTKRRYLVICAYNWGPGAVNRKIVKQYDIDRLSPGELYRTLMQKTPKETSDYLKRVTERMNVYANVIR